MKSDLPHNRQSARILPTGIVLMAKKEEGSSTRRRRVEAFKEMWAPRKPAPEEAAAAAEEPPAELPEDEAPELDELPDEAEEEALPAEDEPAVEDKPLEASSADDLPVVDEDSDLLDEDGILLEEMLAENAEESVDEEASPETEMTEQEENSSVAVPEAATLPPEPASPVEPSGASPVPAPKAAPEPLSQSPTEPPPARRVSEAPSSETGVPAGTEPKAAATAKARPPKLQKAPKPKKDKLGEIKCPACQAKIKVPARLLGKSGKCPTCEAQITLGEKPGRGRYRVACEACAALLTVPAKVLGTDIKCPKCGEQTPVTRGKAMRIDTDEALKLRKETRQVRQPKIASRAAHLAWADMEEARRDSYWVAQWKALIYPFEAIGALIFFVLGVPVTVALAETFSKKLLEILGGHFPGEGPRYYISALVVGVALFAVLSMVSFFSSFIFALVRVSAEGRTASPIIEGMNHRSNLTAVCVWILGYFGPAILVGVLMAGEDEFFVWHPFVIALLGFGMLFAPMGLLCSATVSAIDGLNPVHVFPAIGAIFKEYAYMLLVLIVGTGLFVALGIWVGAQASVMMNTEHGNLVLGGLLRVVSGLLLLFPFVIGTRCVGLLLRYHGNRLPFAFDVHAEDKATMLPLLLAIVGVILLFVPLHREAFAYAKAGGVSNIAWRQIQDIKMRLIKEGETRYPRDYEELEKYVGQAQLVNPVYPDTYPFYRLIPISQRKASEYPKLIWIYTPEPVDPEKKRHYLLLATGTPRKFTPEALDKYLKMQKAFDDEVDPDIKMSYYKRMSGIETQQILSTN